MVLFHIRMSIYKGLLAEILGPSGLFWDFVKAVVSICKFLELLVQ